MFQFYYAALWVKLKEKTCGIWVSGTSLLPNAMFRNETQESESRRYNYMRNGRNENSQ